MKTNSSTEYIYIYIYTYRQTNGHILPQHAPHHNGKPTSTKTLPSEAKGSTEKQLDCEANVPLQEPRHQKTY